MEILAFIGIICLIPLLILYGSMSWGFVMTKLWMWFLLPVFPQMPHITFWQAVGLYIFLTLFKNHGSTAIKDEYKDKTTDWTTTLIGPWITLGCAWFIYQFTH